MIGDAAAPEWLGTHALLTAFGQTEPEAIEGYKSFVAAGTAQPPP